MTSFSDQPLKHTVLKFMAQITQLHLFTLPFTMSPSHHYSRLILTLTNTDNHSLSSVAEARNLSLTIHCLLLSRIMAQNGPSLVSAIITMNTVTIHTGFCNHHHEHSYHIHWFLQSSPSTQLPHTLVSTIITMNTVTTHTGFCNHHHEQLPHTLVSEIITMNTVTTHTDFCNHHHELSYHTHHCPGPGPLWQSAIITMNSVTTHTTVLGHGPSGNLQSSQCTQLSHMLRLHFSPVETLGR